jgi:hypothetical protein
MASSCDLRLATFGRTFDVGIFGSRLIARVPFGGVIAAPAPSSGGFVDATESSSR